MPILTDKIINFIQHANKQNARPTACTSSICDTLAVILRTLNTEQYLYVVN